MFYKLTCIGHGSACKGPSFSQQYIKRAMLAYDTQHDLWVTWTWTSTLAFAGHGKRGQWLGEFRTFSYTKESLKTGSIISVVVILHV